MGQAGATVFGAMVFVVESVRGVGVGCGKTGAPKLVCPGKAKPVNEKSGGGPKAGGGKLEPLSASSRPTTASSFSTTSIIRGATAAAVGARAGAGGKPRIVADAAAVVVTAGAP